MDQTPIDDTDVRHAAAGNLAFLLSVIRSGETLTADEEAVVHKTIDRLTGPSLVDPDAPSVRYLGELQRVTVQPGDQLVLRVSGLLSDHVRARLAADLSRGFAGVPVIVLDHGTELLGVVSGR